MSLFRLGDKQPQLGGNAWVAPNATVIGDVRLAANASIWWNATLRGDNDPIHIGENTNIQDGSVLHTDEGIPMHIGANVTVGHLVVLRGCTVGDGGLIGIGANRLPQIGRLKDHANVFYAQAYAGHGVNATHLAGKLLGEAISTQHSSGFDIFAKVPHMTFPGGKHLRSPLLALGMLWYRAREAAGLL